MSKSNINVVPTTGRSIGQNLRITSKLTNKAAKAGTSIIGGKK